MSGKAYDINKQTVYIAPKSTIASRAHYVPGAGTERVYCGDEMCTTDVAPRAAETARLSLQRLTISNRSADIKRQPSYVFII